MTRERLSQVQKALLLTADEYRREYKTNTIRYRDLLKRLAVRAERIHKRSKRLAEKMFSRRRGKKKEYRAV